jgi:hypothetical protein
MIAHLKFSKVGISFNTRVAGDSPRVARNENDEFRIEEDREFTLINSGNRQAVTARSCWSPIQMLIVTTGLQKIFSVTQYTDSGIAEVCSQTVEPGLVSPANRSPEAGE